MENGHPARCSACVQSFASTKQYRSPPPAEKTIDEQLTEAVGQANVEGVHSLLLSGANPNCVRQLHVLHRNRLCPAYHADGSPMAETDPECHQPTTPLKLVGFRISDCMLTGEDLWRFKQIADLLIAHGGDARDALALMTNRYGEWTAEDAQKHDDESQGMGGDSGKQKARFAVDYAYGFASVFATVAEAAKSPPP